MKRRLSSPDSLTIEISDGETMTIGRMPICSETRLYGLSSLSNRSLSMDILFIDEGFGTLDSDTLDMVMNTLENLRNLGKRVGIISHIDILKERIPVRIQLIREGKSASRVEVVRS